MSRVRQIRGPCSSTFVHGTRRAYGGAMSQSIRRFRGPAAACLAIFGLGALPNEASATPISYNLQIGGGSWSCGSIRPMGQACQGGLSGSMTVDSAMGDFASQLVG